MAFLNIIKKAFGFANEVEDDLLNDSVEQTDDIVASSTEMQLVLPKMPEEVSINPVEVEKIFDHVVSVFNEALPGFLSQAVDPELQRKKLYNSLDDSIKDYLKSVADETRRNCEARWHAEQAEMRNEMEHLKAKAKEIEQQRFDIKQQQLSSDRQRRALTNKVQSLENQVANYEAEREQFDLENKSLVNKLKVAAVHESEAQALRDELIDARAEIVALRNASAGDENSVMEHIENETIAKLEKEITNLNTQLEQAVEKDRVSTEMFNSMRSKVSAAKNEIAQRDAEIESLRQKLAEAENIKEEIDSLNKQMANVDTIIVKRDRKIERLKETCENLRNENESLRATICDNLRTHAENEEALKQRIAELEADPMSPIVSTDLIDEPAAEYEKSVIDLPKISDSDLNEIEEIFDNSDWMSSEPPITPSMRSNVNEADFGYQPPTRKNNRHDNEAQLSLF